MLRYLGGSAMEFVAPRTAFRRLVRAGAGTLALKLVNMALVYATTVLLARLLGAEGYGAYAFALAWVQLALIPAMLGMEHLMVREVARGQAATDPAIIRGVVRLGGSAALAAALLICLGVSFALRFVPAWPSPILNDALTIGIWLLPLLAAIRVLGASVRGLQQIVLAQVPTLLIVPFALLLGLLVLAPAGQVKFTSAVWMHIAAAAAGLLAATLIWNRVWRQGLARGAANYRVRAWLGSALPFMLIGSAHAINLQMDRVMLGAMTDAQTVGVYAVAARNAALVELFLLAINMALAPYVADRFAKEDIRQLQSTVTNAARIVVACTVPAAALMIALAPYLLALFGEAFVQGQTVLIVLVVGHASAVLTGSAATILSMTGHERKVVPAVALGALLNVVFNLLLIPTYGMLGAAVATFVSNLLWRMMVAYRARRLLGLDTTPLGIFASPRTPQRPAPTPRP